MANDTAAHCKHNPIFKTHPLHTGTNGWSIDEFCGAFFHVPTVEKNYHNICTNNCLDANQCIIGQGKEQPKYVIATAVLRKGDTELYSATYCNDVSQTPTKHAEEFFDEDARELDRFNYLEHLKKEQDDLVQRMAGMSVEPSGPLELCLYITLQPCHKSVDNTPNKSCTEKLTNLYQYFTSNLKLNNFKFVVKPTFIYKVRI
jgi:hypothetical protein